MINRILLVIFIGLTGMTISFAQNLEIEMSESLKYAREQRAKTEYITAENDDFVYVLLEAGNPIAKSFLKAKSKKRLQSFDKKTMKPVKYVDLNQDLPSESAKLLSVHSTLHGIVALSRELKNGQSTIFATRYDWNLNAVIRKQKVYTYDEYKNDLEVIVRPGSDDMAFLIQARQKEGEPVIVKYSVFDIEFALVNAGQIEFPIYKRRTKGLFRSYYASASNVLDLIEYTSTGEFVAVIYITPEDADEGPGKYSLQFVDSKTNKVVVKDVRLKGDDFFESVRLIQYDNELILTGFYSNSVTRKQFLTGKEKTTSSSRVAGTFLQRFDIKRRSMIASTQAPFDADFVFNVNSQNPAFRSWMSNKVKNATEEDFSDNYKIRKVFYNPEEKTAKIYCEYISNTVTTTTSTDANGVTSTRTTYTSTRGNFFYYEMSLESGEINYGNIIRKFSSYSSSSSAIWDVVSLQVLPGQKEDVVLYLTQRLFNDRDKSDVKGEKIKTKKFEQDFVTATISNKNGTYKIDPPKLSSGKVQRDKKIQLDKAFWSPSDQALYTVNSRYLVNWPFAAVSCVTLPCCVGYCIWYFFPHQQTREVYTLGRVTQK